jgi:protein TonB
MKKILFATLLLIATISYASPTVPPAPSLNPIVEHANLVNPIKIVYPLNSIRGEEEGTVILKIHVLADGSTSEIVVHKSSGYPSLDSSALITAQEAKFFPAKTKSGIPTDSMVLLPIIFKLSPENSKSVN